MHWNCFCVPEDDRFSLCWTKSMTVQVWSYQWHVFEDICLKIDRCPWKDVIRAFNVLWFSLKAVKTLCGTSPMVRWRRNTMWRLLCFFFGMLTPYLPFFLSFLRTRLYNLNIFRHNFQLCVPKLLSTLILRIPLDPKVHVLAVCAPATAPSSVSTRLTCVDSALGREPSTLVSLSTTKRWSATYR